MGKNRITFQMLGGDTDSSVAALPSMNVLQCASATCFCHRFAMLSCLNLIGWDGWTGGLGQAGEGAVNAAFTSYGNYCVEIEQMS